MESRKTILIIDDDPRNIFALSATLKAKGFDYIACSEAAEAIRVMESDQQIDMVLIDMMMPDMDGYEAIPIMKKMKGREKIPLIAVTAQAMVGDRDKCLAAGADDYISKPIDVDKLMQVMYAYMN